MPARDPDPDFDADARPSKSQRKRESTAAQDLGAQLVQLTTARLQALTLPESLREALLTYRNTRTHEIAASLALHEPAPTPGPER